MSGMRLTPLVLAGFAAGLPCTPLVAQLRSSRPIPAQQNLPRLLVANPHSFSAQDSTAAVRVGAGLRDRIEKSADRWFKVVLRAQMNEALQQYAYPVDALLPPLVARQLGQSLNARAMVVSTLQRGEGGRFTLEARLANMNDDAGFIVRAVQNPNESLEEFGARGADALSPAFRALQDAKACDNQRATAADKAAESAVKALRVQPNHGLAEYCLAQLAIAKKAPVDTIIDHLKNATKGDRLSLPVWTALAVQYQAKGDSAATIETFKEMLRVAPTNEALRKEAFRLFLGYGKPEAAEDVAREGIANDAANADLYDLLSSACLFQDKPEKNKCAVDALVQVYALDTTKADTTFYTKITFAASRPPEDTARFLHWAQRGVAKYPQSGILLGQLAQAYSVAGPVDSALAVTIRLMAVDSSDLTPVLRLAQTLADTSTKRVKDALVLVPYVERLGSPEDKANLGAILTTGSLPLLSGVPDYPAAAELARASLKLLQPGSRTAQYANYVLGLATFQMLLAMDKEAFEQKSCDLVQKLKPMLDEALPALTAGRAINEAIVAPRLQYLQEGVPNRIAQLTKAFCK
jgi:tetratricopeptide (TPR) repeat protein